MKAPLISILIPVYNREHLVVEAIKSVIEQTYQKIEVIISDNNSTDYTYEVCNEIAKKDSRIKVYKNDRNIGPVLNWKRCIEKAKGKYAKILFSDDIIEDVFLEQTIQYFDNEDVGLV